MSDGLTRLSPSTRRGLQIVSVVMIVGGLAMVVTGFASFANSATDFDAGPPMSSMLLFLGGGLVAAAGAGLARFAFLKLVADVVVTETGGAVEYGTAHAGRGLGRGLKESGALSALGGREVVKVRCRACGALDSEDAKFCSACGNAM